MKKMKQEIIEKLSFYQTNLEEVLHDKEIVQLIECIYENKEFFESPIYTKISIGNIGSEFFKDYNWSVNFTIGNKEEKYEIDLYGLKFKKNRLYPLHIIFGDEEIECISLEGLRKKLNVLHKTEFAF